MHCQYPRLAGSSRWRFALTGCSYIEPWVKPYDRENLADPIMVVRRANPISQDFLDHVFESREGARGATGGGGGGCGCN